MTAEVETLTKTRDNLLTQSERLVIQTTKLEKEIVEHRQQINSNKNTIQQLEKLKQRKFYISSCIALTTAVFRQPNAVSSTLICNMISLKASSPCSMPQPDVTPKTTSP